MLMMRLLVLILSFAAAGWSAAWACSPAFPYCDAKGQCESDHRSPNWIQKKNLNKSFDIIAVVTAHKSPLHTPKTAGLSVERVLKGNPPSSFVVDNLSLEPNLSRNIKDPKNRFGLWDHMNIGAQYIADFSSASCSREIKNSLSDGKTYLVFIKSYGSQNHNLLDAILIEDEFDNLVDEIDAILQGRNNAPSNINVKDYFEHMTGFAELAIKTCPSIEDYRYTNSRFATAKSQHEIAFSINDSFNYSQQVIDLRDLASYRNAVIDYHGKIRAYLSEIREKQKSNPSLHLGDLMDQKRKELKSLFFKCQPQSQYLAVFRLKNQKGSLRYLPIENGTVDASDVITNFEFKDMTKVNVTDVKTWIRKANPK